MNIYFDTEFEGLYKDAKLISIGFIDENSRKLYCEFDDINIEKQDEWIKENVLDNTILYGHKDIQDICDDLSLNYFAGSKSEIKEIIEEWLSVYDNVQMVADVSHYDFTFFIDLWEHAFKLPVNISPVCHDINQDISNYYDISDKEAFDLDRETIVKECKYNKDITLNNKKHNSLYDASIVKSIYELCNQNQF